MNLYAQLLHLINMLLLQTHSEGELVHLSADLFLAAAPYAEAREAVVQNCENNGQLEIPELRDRLGTTRKYLIPLLEHFDAIGLTARRGGSRVLKRR